MNKNIRVPINIEYYPYIKDHCFENKPVYPAVEALQTLAHTVKKYSPDSSVLYSCQACFFRFLYMPDQSTSINAFVDLTENPAKSIKASLITQNKTGTRGITRTKEHVCATFKDPSLLVEPPLDCICGLEHVGEKISSHDLYKEMILFGPTYHNIIKDIYLSRTGAAAYIVAPDHASPNNPLGSPFPLDAAFHAACAWGQKYKGITAFPVGYQERYILRPTMPEHHYYCRVFPQTSDQDILIFDLWIYSLEGKLHEAVLGLNMRNISRESMKPLSRILASSHDPLKNISKICPVFTIHENGSLGPFAYLTFSEREKIRFNKLGEKRKQNYSSARIALKRLWRKLNNDDMTTEAKNIETVAEDLVHPWCRMSSEAQAENLCCCSVSHDDRFTVAVADFKPVGIDVEKVSEKPVKGKHLFMNEAEQKMVSLSPLGIIEACVRVWTIKEAAAKALDLTLPETWKKVNVSILGQETSQFLINNHQFTAYHAQVDDHLITLVKLLKTKR